MDDDDAQMGNDHFSRGRYHEEENFDFGEGSSSLSRGDDVGAEDLPLLSPQPSPVPQPPPFPQADPVAQPDPLICLFQCLSELLVVLCPMVVLIR